MKAEVWEGVWKWGALTKVGAGGAGEIFCGNPGPSLPESMKQSLVQHSFQQTPHVQRDRCPSRICLWAGTRADPHPFRSLPFQEHANNHATEALIATKTGAYHLTGNTGVPMGLY